MKHKFVLLILLAPFITSAQLPWPFRPIMEYDYYEAYHVLQQNKDAYTNSEYEDPFWQAQGTLYAFVGQYHKATRSFYIRDSIANRLPDSTDRYNATLIPIRQDSLNILYDKNSVVLFNESHHVSEHRAFLYNQLPFLRENGYKYLAMEALNNHQWLDTNLIDWGYPLYLKTGIYINDPVFAAGIPR